MKKLFRSNLYGMIIVIWGIIFSFTFGALLGRRGLSLYSTAIIGQIVLFVIPVIIYFAITKLPVKETLKLNKIKVKDVFLVILIGITLQPLVMGLSALSTFIMPNSFGQVINKPVDNSSLWVTIFVIGVIPAVLEEITFRGIILSGYDNTSIKKAAIFTGIYFGIIHYDLQRLLYTFALGFIFAYLVRITNSIYSAMICHGVINSVQMIFLKAVLTYSKNNQATSSGGQSLNNMPPEQMIGTIITFIIFIVLGGGLTYLLIKKLKKNNINEMVEVSTAGEISACKGDIEEKIIDWPFIVTVIIYLVLVSVL